MSSSLILRASSLLACLAMSACTTDATTAGSPDAGHAGGDSSTDSSTAPPGLALTWRIVESGAVGVGSDASTTDPLAVRKLPPIVGAKICMYQQSEIPCATSDSDGIFVVRGLQPRTSYVLTTEKTGYVKTLRAIEMSSTDVDNSGSPLVTSKPTPGPDLGFKYDDTKGAISFFALAPESDGGLVLPRGVKVTLSPKHAEGPFFTTPRNTFDRTATTSVGGLGFFFNVEPGDYELRFDAPGLDCAPISLPLAAWGYPAPPNGVKFPVLGGHVTDQMGVLCTQKSVIVGGDSGAPSVDAGNAADAAARD
jgi:hypothetical protein